MVTTGEQQGGACVAQIVEPDVRQTSSLEERLERGRCEVAEVQKLATVGAKDQTVILPHSPSLSRSAFWAALWTLSASTACRVSLMLRPLPFLGVVQIGPVLAWDLVLLTRRTLVSWSSCSHLRPKSSPPRSPAVTAST